MPNHSKLMAEVTEEARMYFDGYWNMTPVGEVVKDLDEELLIVFPDGDTRSLNKKYIERTWLEPL